jgi:hypothetical protein
LTRSLSTLGIRYTPLTARIQSYATKKSWRKTSKRGAPPRPQLTSTKISSSSYSRAMPTRSRARKLSSLVACPSMRSLRRSGSTLTTSRSSKYPRARSAATNSNNSTRWTKMVIASRPACSSCTTNLLSISTSLATRPSQPRSLPSLSFQRSLSDSLSNAASFSSCTSSSSPWSPSSRIDSSPTISEVL